MRVIVVGCWTVTDYGAIERAITQSGLSITEIVSAGTRGVAASAEIWAALHNVPVKRFPVGHSKYAQSAISNRNREMAQYADALIAVYDDRSPGTRNMIETANAFGLTVCV